MQKTKSSRPARLGIFGGSFNPPHLGHLRAAEHFAKAWRLDRVLVVPAGTPPLRHPPAGAGGEDRLALCRLTFSGETFAVCDWELRRQGISYTIDTLRQTRNLWPEAALFLLMGEDQRARFHLWRDWQGILEVAELAVLARKNGNTEDFAPLDISSTQIRDMLARGEDVSPYLAPAALRYIREHGLYAGVADRESCRKLLAGQLGPKRLRHSECVADSAMALARRYGADEHRAMLAGMLHDCMKDTAPEVQREICARAGFPLRPEDLAAPPVWHAFAGAAHLSLNCGVADDALLGAVRWHTTGHAGMTLLEEVVFVADLISADRDYPDVGHVRQLSQRSLHAASKYILGHVFSRLEQDGGRKAHPDSLAWYYELKERT